MFSEHGSPELLILGRACAQHQLHAGRSPATVQLIEPDTLVPRLDVVISSLPLDPYSAHQISENTFAVASRGRVSSADCGDVGATLVTFSKPIVDVCASDAPDFSTLRLAPDLSAKTVYRMSRIETPEIGLGEEGLVEPTSFGAAMFVICVSGGLVFYDLTGEVSRIPFSHPCDAVELKWRRMIATGGYQKRQGSYCVVVFDLEKLQQVSEINEHSGGIWNLGCCKESDLIMTTSVDSYCKLIDCRTFDICGEMKHSGQVRAIRAAPDRFVYCTQSFGGEATIWDSRNLSEPQLRFKPHIGGTDWGCDLRRVSDDSFVSTNLGSDTVRYNLNGKVVARLAGAAGWSVTLVHSPQAFFGHSHQTKVDRELENERLEFAFRDWDLLLLDTSGIVVRLWVFVVPRDSVIQRM